MKDDEEQIKARLVEVHINGFRWFADELTEKLYLDKELNGNTGYNFLTPNEKTQLKNELKYGRK